MRSYRQYPQLVSQSLHVRHSRSIDVDREAIRRPVGATPRSAKDWR